MKETLEVDKKVVISTEDTNNIRNFFKHFNILSTPKLDHALEVFDKEQSYDNQCMVKIAICEAIVTINHEAFKDEMIAGITKESLHVTYQSQFDKELEHVLTEDEVKALEAVKNNKKD